MTTFAPHKALQSIARGKLTLDERIVLHRVTEADWETSSWNRNLLVRTWLKKSKRDPRVGPFQQPIQVQNKILEIVGGIGVLLELQMLYQQLTLKLGRRGGEKEREAREKGERDTRLRALGVSHARTFEALDSAEKVEEGPSYMSTSLIRNSAPPYDRSSTLGIMLL